MSEPKTINIEIDHAAMFRKMLDEAMYVARAITPKHAQDQSHIDEARTVHKILALLNVALASMTSGAEVQQMRDEVNAVVEKLSGALQEIDY